MRRCFWISLFRHIHLSVDRREFAGRFVGLLLALLLVTLAGGSAFAQRSESAADDTESTLFEAIVAEERGDYPTARDLYQLYLDQNGSLANRQIITLRLSVLNEIIRFGVDPAASLMLQALSALEYDNTDQARSYLRTIDEQYRNSYFHDDALYLTGYILMTRQYLFEQAHVWFQRLRLAYPDSVYRDTSQYSEAIILEQLGNTRGAGDLLRDLRTRHARISVSAAGLYWPRDNALSRMWFNRADRRLTMLEERSASSATVIDQQPGQQGERRLQVTVRVDGRELPLILWPSGSVASGIAGNEASASATKRWYAGKLQGDEESWVRVSIQGDTIEGIVSTGGKRIQLHPDTMIGTLDYYLPRRKLDPHKDIVLDDYVVLPPKDDTLVGTTQQDLDVQQRASDKGGANNVTRVAEVNLVIDSQYDAYYANKGLERAMSALNVADGIFREQHGLGLKVSDSRVMHDQNSDPMNLGAVTLEQMLRNFRDYRLTEHESFDDAALTYLFSGNRNTDAAIGLAWIGALCRKDGFDVGVTTPSAYSDLLLTHELGHSLGAAHDTDTRCREQTNQLMWPRISGQTEQNFTDCSLDELTRNSSANCLHDAIDLSLTVRAAADHTFTAIIRNLDTSRAVPGTVFVLDRTAVEFADLPPGCIEKSALEIECRSDALAAGASADYAFKVPSLSTDSATLLAEAEPLQSFEANADNNNLQLVLGYDEDGQVTLTGTRSGGSDQYQDSGESGGASGSGGTGTGGSISVLGLLLLGMSVGLGRRRPFR